MDYKEREARLVENAIAISADLHTHPQFEKYYELVGPQVSGFTGIYDIVARLAEHLTRWEITQLEQGNEPWEDIDWIDVTETIAEQAIENGLNEMYWIDPAAVVAKAIQIVPRA
jgi:hypothetical protein